MGTRTQKRAHVNAWLDAQLHRRLVELARVNDRSVSGELRVAIREHVVRDDQEEGKRLGT
jgi:predicted transcriptional regulator